MTRALQRTRALGLLWLLWLISGVLACSASSNSAPQLRCGDAQCSQSCSALAGSDCDILKGACQRRIFRAVECVRGTPGTLPPVRTLTQAQYRAELLAAAAPDGGLDAGSVDAGPDDAGSVDAGSVNTGGPRSADAGVDTPVDVWSRGLQLLGLLSVEQAAKSAAIDNSTKNVAGYYSSQTRSITLIDYGRASDSAGAQRTLAHELVHALQDQQLGLVALNDRAPQSIDGRFAYGCLIEGEAKLYEELAWSLLQSTVLDDAYWSPELALELKSARSKVVRDSSPYSSLWQLRYPLGLQYLRDTFAHGGNWEVQSLFDAEPSSSIDWLVGYEQNTTRREHLVLPLACPRARVPEGYTRYGEYSLGAVAFFAFLGHNLVHDGVFAVEERWQDAAHWRLDSLSLFTNKLGKTALSYRIRLDDAALAKRLASALTQLKTLDLQVRRLGDELEILAADDPAILATLQTDPAACPTQ